MNKIATIILALVLVLTYSLSALAVIENVYPTDEPYTVKVKLGTQTHLVFNTEIKTASVGNASYFEVVTDKELNKVIITPLRKGVWTNLFVYGKDDTSYVFHIEEQADKTEFHDLLYVKPNADVSIKDLINIVNKKAVEIDPAVRRLVNIYEIYG